MIDKYLYFTLHTDFAYLDTCWSAYNQEKGILPKLFWLRMRWLG